MEVIVLPDLKLAPEQSHGGCAGPSRRVLRGITF